MQKDDEVGKVAQATPVLICERSIWLENAWSPADYDIVWRTVGWYSQESRALHGNVGGRNV